MRTVFFLFLLMLPVILAGQITVQGIVKDSLDNQPLFGIAVSLKDSKTETLTDLDGEFTLSIPNLESDTLIFHCAGFHTKKLPAQKNMEVTMQYTEDIEVVTIGYGPLKKSDLTGKLAGIHVDRDTSKVKPVRLRGNISTGNEPTYIVDGDSIAKFVLDDFLKNNNLTVEDIVSLDVLKDASSTWPNNRRGSNGIIIITTRLKFIGKTYRHTYKYSSMANEYGKGGGNDYLKLEFEQDSVKLSNVKEWSLPNEKGEYKTSRSIEELFSATYRTAQREFIIDNEILPQLKVSGESLIAPQIKIKGIKNSIFENAEFVEVTDGK